MMNRFVKYLAALALVLILVFVASMAVTLIFRKGDTFHPASRTRAVVWLSKRIVAESTALPFLIWDPYRKRHHYAITGPSEQLISLQTRPSFTTGQALQDFFSSSADFRGATVRSFVNSSLPEAALGFSYQPADESMLDSLSSLYSLNDLVNGDTLDYQVLTTVQDWLYKKFYENRGRRKDSLPEVDFNFNALDILYRAAHGERFWCSEFSTTLVQCLAAMGYTARYLMLNSETGGHVLCEAWCETYGKWIMLDPYFDRIVTLDGAPLNVLEIHRLLEEPVQHERAVIIQHGKMLSDPEEKDFYLSLFRNFAVRMRNDWFTNRYPHWYPLSNSVMNAVEWQDELTDDNVYYKRETDCPEELYWPLNRVRITVQPAGGAQLNVFVETFTPNFSHFSVRVDSNRAVSVRDGFFEWELNPGLNELEISSVNQWGISGKPGILIIDRAGD